MGLFDEIERGVMILQETEETEETTAKSLEKRGNKMALVEETEETTAKSLDKPPISDDEDLFQYLIENIRAGGFWASHFDAARRYLKRTLPAEMFEELRREVGA